MLLFGFLEDEHERIAKLEKTEESCRTYRAHYRQLFPEDVKLFYLRSNMWIHPARREEPIPRWIEEMAHDMRCFSSGLADIRPEVIQFSFGKEPPCDYYAITFRLDKEKVKRRIKLAGEVFYMANIGEYILTLTDITGEYDACFGELHRARPIILERQSIEFK